MIIAVVYESETGFTKKYAEWISAELQCDCIPAKEATAERLKKYPFVLYGGWVQGGAVQGLREAREKFRGRYAAFAVGMQPKSEDVLDFLRKRNQLPEDVELFYMEGGMKPHALTKGRTHALELYKKTLCMGNDESRTAQQKFFLDNIGREFDHSDRNTIWPAVDFAEAMKSLKAHS